MREIAHEPDLPVDGVVAVPFESPLLKYGTENLSGQDIREIGFSRHVLQWTDLSNCLMGGVDFSYADLTKANLTRIKKDEHFMCKDAVVRRPDFFRALYDFETRVSLPVLEAILESNRGDEQRDDVLFSSGITVVHNDVVEVAQKVEPYLKYFDDGLGSVLFQRDWKGREYDIEMARLDGVDSKFLKGALYGSSETREHFREAVKYGLLGGLLVSGTDFVIKRGIVSEEVLMGANVLGADGLDLYLGAMALTGAMGLYKLVKGMGAYKAYRSAASRLVDRFK